MTHHRHHHGVCPITHFTHRRRQLLWNTVRVLVVELTTGRGEDVKPCCKPDRLYTATPTLSPFAGKFNVMANAWPARAWLRSSPVLGAFIFAGSINTLRKRLPAVKTAVGLLARVGPLVPRNVALLAEPPWAHGACVGLLAGVGPLGCSTVVFPLVPRNVNGE